VLSSGLAAALTDDGATGRRGSPGCPCCSGRPADELTRTLRGYAADEVRNRQAEKALEAYYHLAEAQGQSRLLLEGQQVVAELIRQAEELQAKGLPPPAELPSLLRERNKLASDAVELSLASGQLQEQLRYLCDLGGNVTVRTQEEGRPQVTPLEVEAHVAAALAHRPDLLFLRAAAEGANARALPALQLALSASNALLGPSGPNCLPLVGCLLRLVPCVARGEVDKVRGQLEALLAERERQAAAEVRAAALEARARAELAVLAQGREDLARKQVAEWEEKERKGLKFVDELSKARRDLLRARGDSLHAAVAFELAGVKLRQAKGLLVYEVLGPGRAAGCAGPAEGAPSAPGAAP
jgi:outer membrane protein TolC